MAMAALLLQGAALAMVVGYYNFKTVRSVLDVFGAWQSSSGHWAAFLNRVVFCGVLPGLVMTVIPSLRPKKALFTLVMQSLWCGLVGICVDIFVTLQSSWFGCGTDFWTLIRKTAVDQFVWTVFFIAPINSVFYFWAGRGFSISRFRREWPRSFFRAQFLPNLISTWAIWIPVIFIVYAFPLPLQVQVGGFAGCFWTLLVLRLGSREDPKAACQSEE